MFKWHVHVKKVGGPHFKVSLCFGFRRDEHSRFWKVQGRGGDPSFWEGGTNDSAST